MLAAVFKAIDFNAVSNAFGYTLVKPLFNVKLVSCVNPCSAPVYIDVGLVAIVSKLKPISPSMLDASYPVNTVPDILNTLLMSMAGFGAARCILAIFMLLDYGTSARRSAMPMVKTFDVSYYAVY